MWNNDTECCEVKITLDGSDKVKYLNFRYTEEDNDLTIELSEDSFYRTREFDETIKYFWILVAPALFPITETL
jgi:hypothetical protein